MDRLDTRCSGRTGKALRNAHGSSVPEAEHIALTPELVLRFIDKNPGSEVLSLKPGPVLDTVIWKNGVSRSGKRVSADHLCLRPFFEKFMDPAPAE